MTIFLKPIDPLKKKQKQERKKKKTSFQNVNTSFSFFESKKKLLKKIPTKDDTCSAIHVLD